MYGCIYKTISIYKAVFTGGIYKPRYLQCYLPLTRLKTITLTQCARIRVPLVVMKIEKFKDLFRAALDRWLDSHESKNFGFGRTRWPIRPIFSAILPILGKI